MKSEEPDLGLVESVNRGATLLDVVWPLWFTSINWRKFDLWSERWGLLEQICGSQEKAVKGLALRDSAFASKLAHDRDNAAAYYGFIVRGGRELWDAATKLWHAHGERRLRDHAEKVSRLARAEGAALGPEI